MQDGLVRGKGSPTGFSPPVCASMRKTITLLPGIFAHSRNLPPAASALPELIAVTAVSRYGQLGQPFVAQRVNQP